MEMFGEPERKALTGIQLPNRQRPLWFPFPQAAQPLKLIPIRRAFLIDLQVNKRQEKK